MTQAPDLPNTISSGALVSDRAVLESSVTVGHFALIDPEGGGGTRIGRGSSIGSHALIEDDVVIGEDCVIDPYCRICAGARVGDGTKILYGAAVFEGVSIGQKCIIGGNVSDRTIVEDFVTYFGEIAHGYRIPGDLEAWDGPSQPSPIIRARSVIGQNALLVGGIEIGEGAYVAAGEIVRCNVPPHHMLVHGRLRDLSGFRGRIQARSD
ncbi:MAG TPA: hypothetical protein VGG92_04035 [Caulobacteraceae bacterium]|jgi:acetyltransferase-like isoleucine patch superfamily enzyme